MTSDELFNNLRQKLDILGYHQPLPLPAISLVGALFEDLVKTTESLRNAKLQISKLFEEKSCWELGVEPYKCDNSRLLADCNALHLELMKQKEEFEGQICDYAKKIRNLESDKLCLEDHCIELERQVRDLTLKYSDAKFLKSKKDGVNMSKKPFVSTVRTGVLLPNRSQDHCSKCTKCQNIIWTKQTGGSFSIEIERLQNDVREMSDQAELYKKKVEERDREIRRLNELLTGGRPQAALAKDCCYKNVGSLSEDVENLQKQKIENLKVIQEIQESMHEAKKRAVCLAERNKQLEKELKELKATALSVEQQANEEIIKKECDIGKLNEEIKKLKNLKSENNENKHLDKQRSADEKLKLNERLNELILREKQLEAEIERITKKNMKLKNRLDALQKESEEKLNRADKSISTEINEERIRLKSERDLFQKEYLRLVEKSGSSTEICYLKSLLKEKEDELCNLRAEICQLRAQTTRTNFNKSSLSTSGSVQAAILRAERERDIAGMELDHVKIERDALREKLQNSTEAQIFETDRFCKEIRQLNMKISNLEKENRELLSSRIPEQTHLTLMKEEIEELKKRLSELQAENCKLSTSHNQLKILHEQTERALIEHQNKFAISETNLRNAESRLGSLSTNRDTSRTEVCALRKEIAVLKLTNTALEQEKDKAMVDLDLKTEEFYRKENELKLLKRTKNDLELIISDLQVKLDQVTCVKKERENELQETSTERRTLRQQINTLKEIRDQAVAENSRLSNELADVKAEVCLTKKKLKDSEKEVERLKQQLQQYVQKVQKAENLLMQKEREREEMLEHYRTLSHDAILLEGNNQSLEMEAAEHKRQLFDAEEEISILKQELRAKECTIEKLEKQVSVLSSQICSLEKDLDQAYDDQKLLKADLDAMKELCEKLDLQSEKQNAELQERGEIISKLEKENSGLRKNLSSLSTSDKAATDILQNLLVESRQELESERKAICKLAQEKLDLRKRIEEIQKKVEEEREKASQKETLAKEYSVQIQEMQHNLTDDRFKRARSREESPRFPKLRLSSGGGCPSRGSDMPGCESGSHKNRTCCADANIASNNYSSVYRATDPNICQNVCSNKMSSKMCQKICAIEVRTKDKNRNQNLNCSSERTSFKSSPNTPKASSLKCMKSILKSIPPCKRSDLLQDVNNFLKGSECVSSYDETISVNEDSDDIIIRRTRNVKTGKNETSKPFGGESKEWAFMLSCLRFLSKYVNAAWGTILSSTSRSSPNSSKMEKGKSYRRVSSPYGITLKEKKSSLHVSSCKAEAKIKKKEKSKSIYIPAVPIKAPKEKQVIKPTPLKKKTFERKKENRESSPGSRILKRVDLEDMGPEISTENLKRKPCVKKDPIKESLDKNKNDTQNSASTKPPLQSPRDNNAKAKKFTDIKPKKVTDKTTTRPKMKVEMDKEKIPIIKQTDHAQKPVLKEECKKKINTQTEVKKAAVLGEIKKEDKKEGKKKTQEDKKQKKEDEKPRKEENLNSCLKTEPIKKEEDLDDEYFDVYRLAPEPRGYDDYDWGGYEQSMISSRDMSTQTELVSIEIKKESGDIKPTVKVKSEHPEVKSSVKVKKEFAERVPRRQVNKGYPQVRPKVESTKIKPIVKVKKEPPEVKSNVKRPEESTFIKPALRVKKEFLETKKPSVVQSNMNTEDVTLEVGALEHTSSEPNTEEKMITAGAKEAKEGEVRREQSANEKDTQNTSLPDARGYEDFSPEATSSFEEYNNGNMPVADLPKTTLPEVREYERLSSGANSLFEELNNENMPVADSPKTTLPEVREYEKVCPETTSSFEEHKGENMPVAGVSAVLPAYVKKRLVVPLPFKGCGCMKTRYEKLRTFVNGDSSMSIRNDRVAYYRRSIICKRSNNRIEQTYLLERGSSRTMHPPEFDISCLPPPPEYDRCKNKK